MTVFGAIMFTVGSRSTTIELSTEPSNLHGIVQVCLLTEEYTGV